MSSLLTSSSPVCAFNIILNVSCTFNGNIGCNNFDQLASKVIVSCTSIGDLIGIKFCLCTLKDAILHVSGIFAVAVNFFVRGASFCILKHLLTRSWHTSYLDFLLLGMVSPTLLAKLQRLCVLMKLILVPPMLLIDIRDDAVKFAFGADVKDPLLKLKTISVKLHSSRFFGGLSGWLMLRR